MKKIISTIAFSVVCGFAFGQNSALYKAQALKDKGQLQEAAEVLAEAIQNPKTTKFADMYNTAAEVQTMIFYPELQKAGSGLPFDTLTFVNSLDKAIMFYTKSHEYDIAPDKKGKVDPKFLESNKGRIKSMLDYYNYAAVFMNQCHDADKSMELFKKYLSLPKNPVFSKQETDSIYASKHSAYSQTAFNLAVLNYQQKKWDEALVYVDEALKDTNGTHDLYVIKMQAFQAKNDSASWLNTLKEAVARTEDENFMQNLLFYYVNKNAVAEADEMANEMVKTNPDSKAAWYMKGCVELNLKKNYAAARECFEKALALDPDYVEANVNMTYAYTNEIVALKNSGAFKYIGHNITMKDKANYEKELKEVKSYYEKAMPYMEKVRSLVPDKPKVWVYSLQMIYDNLLMKEKKAEMDQIIESL